jgi:hypothetical protein
LWLIFPLLPSCQWHLWLIFGVTDKVPIQPQPCFSTPLEIFVADFSFVATMPVEFVADFWGSQAQFLFNLNLAYHPRNNCG